VSECFKNSVIFEIPSDEFNAEVMFDQIEKHKEALAINNWAISEVTLEDIFIKFTEEDI